jgi:LysR family hydrogen peroxide-inducible transcriptional activator
MSVQTLPTVTQLRALVALAESRHYGAAASALGVSQPAVSSAINGLEAALGVTLVERTTRRVLVTPAGAEVAVRAGEVLAALDALIEVAESASKPFTGALRLGVIPTVAPYLLAPVLHTLARRFPQVQPDVVEGQTDHLVRELTAGRVELLLLALPVGASGPRSGPDDIHEIALYDEDFVLLVPERHPLAGASDLELSVLAGQPLLLLEEGHCLRDQALDLCRQVGAATNHPARATSLTTVAQLVAGGLGVTLLPASAIAVEARKARVATASFRSPAPGRRIGLAYRAASGRRAEYAEIAEHLRAALAAGPLPVRVVDQ